MFAFAARVKVKTFNHRVYRGTQGKPNRLALLTMVGSLLFASVRLGSLLLAEVINFGLVVRRCLLSWWRALATDSTVTRLL